jgi:hypothetical protein
VFLAKSQNGEVAAKEPACSEGKIYFFPPYPIIIPAFLVFLLHFSKSGIMFLKPWNNEKIFIR